MTGSTDFDISRTDDHAAVIAVPGLARFPTSGEILRPLAELLRSRRGLLRALVYAATVLMVVGLTIQRSFYPHPHWTFWIFRASFWHLVRGENLYAHYGTHDLFKYSPTAALLFAPFAWPSFPIGLLLWNTLNVVVLFVALRSIVRRRDVTLAWLLVLPELFNALQASQSNALVAALIVAAFVALEQSRQLRATLAIAVGVAIKIFPIAAMSLLLFHRRRVRGLCLFALCGAALVLLPLLVTSPATLLSQYGWWRDVEASDAVARGASVMQMLHQALRVSWPNWPVQAAGTVALFLPLLRRDQWESRRFRVTYLASLLVFVVIFNHQAERPSFVIAATGVAIWFVGSPRDRGRLALALFSLTGLLAWSYLPVWVMMQCELHGVLVSRGEEHADQPAMIRAMSFEPLATLSSAPCIAPNDASARSQASSGSGALASSSSTRSAPSA